jgi:hypothetical protein
MGHHKFHMLQNSLALTLKIDVNANELCQCVYAEVVQCQKK